MRQNINQHNKSATHGKMKTSKNFHTYIYITKEHRQKGPRPKQKGPRPKQKIMKDTNSSKKRQEQ